MNHIQKMDGNSFRMDSGDLVPISSTDTPQIRERFMDWTFVKAWEAL